MIHPLHTQAWIDQCLAAGMPRFEIKNRCTGKSTAQAMKALAWAIMHPGQPLRLYDHHGTLPATRNLLYMALEMSRKLELKHMHFNLAESSVTFENRERSE